MEHSSLTRDGSHALGPLPHAHAPAREWYFWLWDCAVVHLIIELRSVSSTSVPRQPRISGSGRRRQAIELAAAGSVAMINSRS